MAGERCPCDVRPLEADLVGPPGVSPLDIVDGHSSQIRRLLLALASGGRLERVLFVGLGTGQMISRLRTHHPHVAADVIEYDINMVSK